MAIFWEFRPAGRCDLRDGETFLLHLQDELPNLSREQKPNKEETRTFFSFHGFTTPSAGTLDPKKEKRFACRS